MSRRAVVIPFPRSRRRKSFTLSAFSADRERFERQATLFFASYVGVGIALVLLLQLYAMR